MWWGETQPRRDDTWPHAVVKFECLYCRPVGGCYFAIHFWCDWWMRRFRYCYIFHGSLESHVSQSKYTVLYYCSTRYLSDFYFRVVRGPTIACQVESKDTSPTEGTNHTSEQYAAIVKIRTFLLTFDLLLTVQYITNVTVQCDTGRSPRYWCTGGFSCPRRTRGRNFRWWIIDTECVCVSECGHHARSCGWVWETWCFAPPKRRCGWANSGTIFDCAFRY